MMPLPPYAPTPHSYVPNTALSATINLDEEVELATTRAEHDLYDSLAELFSIIVTLDGLERALLKDLVPEAEYTELCERMLKQYRSILTDETVAKAFVDLDTFKQTWEIEAPRATERIRVGVPLTRAGSPGRDDAKSPVGAAAVGGDDVAAGNAANPGSSATPGPSAPTPTPAATATPAGGGGAPPPPDALLSGKLILEATQDFITFLDGVKIGLLSKDQLHPLLTEVIQSVNKVTTRDFDCRGKIVQWLITLNQMKATDQLTDDQARELSMDIHQAYQGFKSTLT